MAREGRDGAKLANYISGVPVQCWHCEQGNHKTCDNRKELSLRTNGFVCQCACQDTQDSVSPHGLAKSILSAGGQRIGMVTGDGRRFMSGPGTVGV